ncbi:FAD-binding domain-containing protein, partial [Cristinia sonorae]
MNFETFRAQFKGDLVTPTDPDFELAIDRWAANAKRRAAVVAFTKDAEDVALAIKYARGATLRIAVRGGGHSPAGTSSCEDGLVVDLSRYMNAVRVDPEMRLAYVQGGAQWVAVDREAIKYGLAAVAGTVNHTGVGGLSVGGGYGWQSAAHGLVIDNTIQHTVVTADSRILTANKESHPNLFWGIRGGGSNFGVVTEFVFKLHPQRPTVFAGQIIYSEDKCEEIAAFLDEWWPRASEKEGCMSAMARGPDGNPCIVLFVFYNGTEKEGREAYKGLFDIAHLVDHTKEVPYEELNAMTNPQADWGANYYFKGVLLGAKPSDDLNPRIFSQIMEMSNCKDLSVAILLEFIPHGKINSVPASATPFRRDLRGNTLILVKWVNDSPGMNQKARDLANTIAQILPTGEGYGNYAPDSDALPVSGAMPSDRSKALFREAYPRLQAVKKEYDPDMVFNQWYTVVPA